MALNYLILIRHSNPDIVTNRPANEWRLSESGRLRATHLAEHLSLYSPTVFYSSNEPKAVETAEIMASSLGRPYLIRHGLQEHARETLEWTDQDSFQKQVRHLFERPDELVFGEETANQALARFRGSVLELLKLHPDESIAITSHGTVMTLFVCGPNPLEPIQFWSSLELPALVVLRRPTLELEVIVDLEQT